MSGRRWPLEPLIDAAGLRPCPHPQTGVPVGVARQLADRIGVNRRVVYRALHEGLNEAQADRWAIACGLHPAVVWPSWLDQAVPA